MEPYGPLWIPIDLRWPVQCDRRWNGGVTQAVTQDGLTQGVTEDGMQCDPRWNKGVTHAVTEDGI